MQRECSGLHAHRACGHVAHTHIYMRVCLRAAFWFWLPINKLRVNPSTREVQLNFNLMDRASGPVTAVCRGFAQSQTLTLQTGAMKAGKLTRDDALRSPLPPPSSHPQLPCRSDWDGRWRFRNPTDQTTNCLIILIMVSVHTRCFPR